MKKPPHLTIKNKTETHLTKEIPLDFQTRKKQYDELKKLRQSLKEKKAKLIEEAKKKRACTEGHKRQNEINMIKSGKYDIIKNPTKIKKWKKKARHLLQKLPPELFYEKNK